MFEYINKLRPYFHSLREIEGNVSLDLKFPLTWEYEHIISDFSVQYKLQDKNTKITLVSLIDSATELGYDNVSNCAIKIIEYNREQEDKKRLFNEKIEELKTLFSEFSLEELKKFDLLKTNGKESTTGFEMAQQPNRERQTRNRKSQEKVDS